jgi:ketosteroid isomerase-like protein
VSQEENVQVVLDVFRAFRERDDDALYARYASDIEWDVSGVSSWLGQPLFRGHEGVREFYRQWLEGFSDYRADAHDPVAVGEQVIVTVAERGVGRRSGVNVERNTCAIWTVRDGLVARYKLVDSRSEALKAVGLEE